jgi:hypothetical protein
MGLAVNLSSVRDYHSRPSHIGDSMRVLIVLATDVALTVSGVLRLKEWAYAGFTFAGVAAFITHYLAKDGPKAFPPLVLLILLFISFVTRPASRQCQVNAIKTWQANTRRLRLS